MSTSFTRSVRSLQAEDSRTTLIALIAAATLLTGWLLWFFFARLSLYAVSEPLTVAPTETLRATFPASSAPDIVQGKPARLLLTGTSRTEPLTIPGLVHQTATQPDGSIIADIHIHWAQSPLNSVPHGVAGRIHVETEQISPAQLFIRAAGASAPAP